MRTAPSIGGIVQRLRPYLWLIIALAIGALVRFWDLTGPSLFIDEGFVFHISAQPPKQILYLVAHQDFHPPLFYLITHALMTTLRWPLWDYRYFTAAFSLLGIAATWSIARQLFGPTAAAVAALALALNPATVEWDRLYRMYAVLVALGAVSWWLLLRASASAGASRLWWWLLYAITAVALPYTHYVGGLIVAAQWIYALTQYRRLWPALVAGIVALIAFVPWLPSVAVQYPNGGLVVPISSPSFSWLAAIRATLVYAVPNAWINNTPFDLIFSLIAGAVAIYGVYLGRRTILPYWLLPALVHVIATLLLGKNLVIPRYLYVYVPPFCIALGAVTATLAATRYRVAAVVLIVIFLGIGAVGIPNQLFDPYYQFPDWYQVNALLLAHEKPNDIIVMVQGAEYDIVADYSAFRTHPIDAPGLPSHVPISIRWLRRHPRQRVWYIENQPEFTDPNRQIEIDLDKTRPRIAGWRQERAFREDVVRIELYGPRLAPAGRSKSTVKSVSP